MKKKRSAPKHIIEKFQYIMEKKIPKPSSEETTDHRQKSEHQEDIKLSSSNTGNRALIIVKKKNNHFSVFNTISEFTGRKLFKTGFHIQGNSTQRSNLQVQ